MTSPTLQFTLSFPQFLCSGDRVSFSEDESMIACISIDPFDENVLQLFHHDGNTYNLVYSKYYKNEPKFLKVRKVNEGIYLIFYQEHSKSGSCFVHNFNVFTGELQLVFTNDKQCFLIQDQIFELTDQKSLKITNLLNFPAQYVIVIQNVNQFYIEADQREPQLITISDQKETVYTLPELNQVNFQKRFNDQKIRSQFFVHGYNDKCSPAYIYQRYLHRNYDYCAIISGLDLIIGPRPPISKSVYQKNSIRFLNGKMIITGERFKLLRNFGDCGIHQIESTRYVLSTIILTNPYIPEYKHYYHDTMTAKKVNILQDDEKIFIVKNKYIFAMNVIQFRVYTI